MLDGEGALPFMLFGLAGSISSVETTADDSPETARLTALDARVSLTAGKLFWSAVAPYATVRAFGGPVLWSRHDADLTGSDQHHFQLGAGLLASTGTIDAFVELVPLGERAATFGAAMVF